MTTTTTIPLPMKTLRTAAAAADAAAEPSSLLLSVANKHPRDARIVFDEEPHLYYVDGQGGNTSVTTLIHYLFPKFDAERMSRNCANFAARTGDPTYKYHGMSAEQIQKLWRDKGEEASRAGTEMHLFIELFYNGVEEVVRRVRDPEDPLTPELRFFRNFLRDYPHLRAHRTEWCVFDESLKLSGSIDMVFFNEKTQTYAIYDWKRVADLVPGASSSSSPPKGKSGGAFGIWPCSARVPDSKLGHYTLQLNIYKYILETHYDMRITELALVVLHPGNEDYQVVPLEDWGATIVRDVLAFRREMLARGDRMPMRQPTSSSLSALRADPALAASSIPLAWMPPATTTAEEETTTNAGGGGGDNEFADFAVAKKRLRITACSIDDDLFVSPRKLN